ncbi:MAG: hypothetical protein AB7T59_07695 [Hyphomonadaceae bacterium]
MSQAEDDIAPEYDFTGAARGKFHRAGAALVPPIHLDPDVLAALQARAKAEGKELNAYVNALLKADLKRSGP